MEVQLNIQKAIEFLLLQEYTSEFEVIDGLNRHPDYINFYGWLLRKKIISQEDHDRVQDALEQERKAEEESDHPY